MKISVVIPTYNRKDKLMKVLNAFCRQSFDDFEVVIVDDGSNDGTGDMISKINLPFKIKYLFQHNKGPAAARNLGISHTQGDIIFFTGDDIISSSNLLSEHIKKHNVEDKKIAVLGYTKWLPQIKMTPFRRYISNYHFAYSSIKDENNVDWGLFYTSNISVHKSFLESVGLFDEDFPYAAYEDTELSYRLVRQGLKIIFNKNALAYHDHEISFKDYQKTMLNKGKAAVILARKIPSLSRKASYHQTNNPLRLVLKKLALNKMTLPVFTRIICALDELFIPLPKQVYVKILDYYRILGINYQKKH